MKPRAEARFAAESAQLFPRPDEHLLREIVGGIFTHHAPRERMDPIHRRAVKSLEGGMVPPGGQGDVPGLSVLRHALYQTPVPDPKRFSPVSDCPIVVKVGTCLAAGMAAFPPLVRSTAAP